jgi:cytochrome c-type biogenesis protein CcmE
MTTTPVSWEKAKVAAKSRPANNNRVKFAIATVLLLGAMAFMMFNGTLFNGRFFITVDELLSRPDLVSKSVKITGAVIGDTIDFDPDTQVLSFTIAHVTDKIEELEDEGGLAKVLHEAVSDPTAQRLKVVVRNQPLPDLLRDEAQAILTGKLGADGVFYADELNLKCPSKYEGDVPKQVERAS